MTELFYSALVTMAAPFAAFYLLLRPKYRPLLGRFRPHVPLPPAGQRPRPLWIHACSVGEVNVARPIVEAATTRWPDLPLLLTVSTVSGRDLARNVLPRVPLTWLPFDHPACVGPFRRELDPRALVLLDTELWPCLIRSLRLSAVPVILANGRISDKHFPRYQRMRGLLRPALQDLSAAAMQNEEYAGRLVELGVPPERVCVCGSTKFDGVRESVDPGKVEELRAQCGFGPADPVIVFGSTRPGDEALAAACWASLRDIDIFPGLRLVVAPRHLDRLHDAMEPFREPVQRRSEGGVNKGARVFFLDTVGELVDFYALGTVAVIGGSFSPGVNGHNPLESAALGVPTVFGPYMRNFIDPARELVTHKGALQTNSSELAAVLRRLLENPGERAALALNGREAVRRNQGAIKRTLDLVEPFLGL
ncbi:MAG: 3-deoxy-D-manno-octulosonic acid transferase [Candidatus Hydrogenedentes bacterium]|nr:3-deoxy-D-manno-octulosonic acid transferase [Candidatus Hydrogenedentota bacterium]